MRPCFYLPPAALLLLLLVVGSDRFYAARRLHRLTDQAARKAEPAERALRGRVLWVWERPEDLRTIDPATTAVAVLEETLHLGSTATPIPRRQPVVTPEGTQQIAVVRIETDPYFAAHRDEAALLRDAAADLALVAHRPGIAALEIDFDARKSQRAFYRRLLQELRMQMPAGLPLEITALVSWCSEDESGNDSGNDSGNESGDESGDDWIRGLPIDAATPMFFRMEPDRRRPGSAPEYALQEPLCSSSLGVSTNEPWPRQMAGKRVYIFADHGWASDLARLFPKPGRASESARLQTSSFSHLPAGRQLP